MTQIYLLKYIRILTLFMIDQLRKEIISKLIVCYITLSPIKENSKVQNVIIEYPIPYKDNFSITKYIDIL